MKPGSGPRRKGHDFERLAARALQAVWASAYRCLQYQRDHDDPDVSAGPLWVECKAGRRVNVGRAWLEAEAKRAASRPIIEGRHVATAVIHKAKHRGEVLITLPLSEFVWLMETAGIK